MPTSFRCCQTVPTPLSGLALAIASVGICIDNRISLGGQLQQVNAVFAAILLLAVALKFITNPTLFKQELSHPLLGSVMPTFAMGLMMLSVSLGLHWPELAPLLWLVAIGLHLSLLVGFSYYRCRNWDLKLMVPSWFVPPVGIIVAALTCPNEAMQPLAQGLMWFGTANFLLLMPIMLYRLTLHNFDDPKLQPTFAVMAAPASMLLAGYLMVVEAPQALPVSMLLGMALLLTLLVYMAMPNLIRLPFSPAFASFTFPLVVGATALYQVADKAMLLGIGTGVLARQLADVELLVAICLTGYVCVRYLNAYWIKAPRH